jgi:hypothetical protein
LHAGALKRVAGSAFDFFNVGDLCAVGLADSVIVDIKRQRAVNGVNGSIVFIDASLLIGKFGLSVGNANDFV